VAWLNRANKNCLLAQTRALVFQNEGPGCLGFDSSFFNDVGSGAFDKSKNVTAFSFGNLKSSQRGLQMAEE
jgi:hypothetical protein